MYLVQRILYYIPKTTCSYFVLFLPPRGYRKSEETISYPRVYVCTPFVFTMPPKLESNAVRFLGRFKSSQAVSKLATVATCKQPHRYPFKNTRPRRCRAACFTTCIARRCTACGRSERTEPPFYRAKETCVSRSSRLGRHSTCFCGPNIVQTVPFEGPSNSMNAR